MGAPATVLTTAGGARTTTTPAGCTCRNCGVKDTGAPLVVATMGGAARIRPPCMGLRKPRCGLRIGTAGETGRRHLLGDLVPPTCVATGPRAVFACGAKMTTLEPEVKRTAGPTAAALTLPPMGCEPAPNCAKVVSTTAQLLAARAAKEGAREQRTPRPEPCDDVLAASPAATSATSGATKGLRSSMDQAPRNLVASASTCRANAKSAAASSSIGSGASSASFCSSSCFVWSSPSTC
mmetsp:Transcript_26796/g.77233  ORF Transcript_26796/g.77233 Transcript_26796/m.77233 type:complete len:237 (+) Transcript_26796:404-1114(+)